MLIPECDYDGLEVSCEHFLLTQHCSAGIVLLQVCCLDLLLKNSVNFGFVRRGDFGPAHGAFKLCFEEFIQALDAEEVSARQLGWLHHDLHADAAILVELRPLFLALAFLLFFLLLSFLDVLRLRLELGMVFGLFNILHILHFNVLIGRCWGISRFHRSLPKFDYILI